MIDTNRKKQKIIIVNPIDRKWKYVKITWYKLFQYISYKLKLILKSEKLYEL